MSRVDEILECQSTRGVAPPQINSQRESISENSSRVGDSMTCTTSELFALLKRHAEPNLVRVLGDHTVATRPLRPCGPRCFGL